tara:strand:+ start:1582 stop:2154 length:573 start_codon:yes stop_codon:yes gene_type:complete
MRIQFSHGPENLLVEDSTHSGESHEDGGLYEVDDFWEGLELLTLVVIAGEIDFVLSESISSVVCDQTLGLLAKVTKMEWNTCLCIDKPEATSCLVFSQALFHEVLNDLLSDTHTGTSSTHKDSSLVLGWNTALLQGVDDTGEDNSTGSLNVIVEHGVLVLISLKCRERIFKVLKLHDDTAIHQHVSVSDE